MDPQLKGPHQVGPIRVLLSSYMSTKELKLAEASLGHTGATPAWTFGSCASTDNSLENLR